MRHSSIKIWCCSFAMVTLFALTANGQPGGSYCQTLYDEWHEALRANPALTEPMWFSTDGPKDLAVAVSQIKSNKIAMAYFLCEKIASEGKAGYPDALLLDKVAGIDLLRASDRPFMHQDFGANLAKFSAQFAKDWREGVYKDPSARIAQLLSKLPKREGKSISPLDLVEIRRFGIFALPELIRQIKQNNSRHAFAACLIITGQRDEYSQYLDLNDWQFTSAAAKLDHLKAGVKKMKSENGADGFEITKNMSTALAGYATKEAQPRFALYLVKAHHAEIAKMELESQPLLTEQDIVSYDWPTHTMTLTESGQKKIPDAKAAGTFGKEFVIVADGQHCYRGAFWTSFSSVGCNSPVIDVTQRGPAVQIQRAYPSDRFATGDDPRPDKRIYRVLEALGKITNVEVIKDKWH